MFEAATDREIRVGCDGGLLLTDAGTLFSNEKTSPQSLPMEEEGVGPYITLR